MEELIDPDKTDAAQNNNNYIVHCRYYNYTVKIQS